MSWSKALPLILLSANAVAGAGYVVGGGIEGDSADGLAASVIGDFGITEKTWLSAALARNSVDLPARSANDSWYADVGIDHWFDPVGFRVGAAYWGDKDTLDSNDWRASLYWRADKFTIAGDFESRDFMFDFPAFGQIPARTVDFKADGIGLSTRFDITDSVDLGLSGMDYDYDVNLRLDNNRGLLDLLSFSRLSLINSLVDYRANASIGVDVGERRWQFDVGTWKGAADGSTTRSATVRFLNPLGKNGDIEFSLGVDDSDLYGNVTFFSVFLFFYGGT